jgi:outer membrane protein TolC
MAAGAPLHAQQPTVRLSIDDAVERAVVRNEEVLVARAERARAEGLATEVRARSLPEVTLDFGYTRNLQTPVLFFNQPGEGTQQISIGNDNDYSLALGLRQPLLDLTLGPARSAARLSRDAGDASVEAARVQVALDARVAYYQALLDQALLEVQERALEAARSRLDQVESFRRAGTASEFDLLTAQVEVDNIRPLVIEARNRLALDRDRLKRVIGLSLDERVELTDSLREPEGEPPTMAGAMETAQDSRSDLRGQRIRVRLQEENLAVEDRSGFPTLSLTASFLRRASSSDVLPPERDFSQSASAGLSLSVPIFDGRERAGRIQQARAALERERYRLEQLRESVRLEVQQAHRNLASARERIDASSSNVRRAERALEIAQTRFSNGLGTQVELNDAELAVTRARTNYVQALYGYRVARAQLLRAQGRR